MYNMDIRDFEGNSVNTEIMEKQEQDLANEYIIATDVVLELGARYGSVSCIINSKLNNKNNQVVVEPDDRVWNALEENRKRNNCEFNIVKGFISNKKLDLTNLDDWYGGYGSTFVENNDTKISSYSLNEVKQKYNLNFNVLVADCEGFLETFFDENPDFYDELRLIIFEADYCEKCNYNKIKNKLAEKKFIKLLEGHQNVWIKSNSYIKYYLIHCHQHTDRIEHINSIIKRFTRPIEIFDGIYTANADMNKQLDILQSYDNNLRFNVNAGKQYPIYDREFMFNSNNHFQFYLPGQIGCYLSHHMIIKQVMDDKLNHKNISEYTVIFEDDIQFSSNLDLHLAITNIIHDMKSINTDFDIIYLGSLNDNHETNVTNNVYRIDNTKGCFGTHAMLINNANLEKIYQSNCNIIHAIDNQYFFNTVNNHLNGFVIHPSICYQTSDLSSNIDSNNNFAKSLI